jgi:hypothetical protein
MKSEEINEVTIIINGERYDAVKMRTDKNCCKVCELPIKICGTCGALLNDYQTFKKSNKTFEK